MQTDHPISARKLDLILINMKKRACLQVDSAVPNKNERKRKDRQMLGAEKALEHKDDGDTNRS